MAAKTKQAAGGDSRLAWTTKVVGPGESVFETFQEGGRVLCWTGRALKGLDIATGALAGKAKAEDGRPWTVGGEVFIPTPKGFDVRTPALEAVRAVAVPAPKGTKFRAACASLHGSLALRVTRANDAVKDGPTPGQAYALHAHDVATKKQRYHVPLRCTWFPQVNGRATAERFAVEFRTETGYEVMHGAVAEGAVAGTTTLAHSRLVEAGGDIFQQGGDGPVRVLRDGWVELPCAGSVRALGAHVYCVGEREVVRLDGAKVAARAAIDGAPAQGRGWTSACVGEGVILVAVGLGLGGAVERPSRYRVQRHDPVTLATVGAPVELDADLAFTLVGSHGGVTVATVGPQALGFRLG